MPLLAHDWVTPYWVLRADSGFPLPYERRNMIILGLILLIIGYAAGISLLYYIGGLLLIVGIVLLILGRTGRAVGGRANWF